MVSDAEQLLSLIERDPLNVLLRGMLADELYGVHGMTWSEATAKGLDAARRANNARNLAMGAKLCCASRSWHEPLMWQACLFARLDYFACRNVYVFGGSTLPVGIPTGRISAVGVHTLDIQVGAEWVVVTVRQLVYRTQHQAAVARITRGFVSSSLIE